MPAPTIVSGTRLGNYLIQEPIGSGGMGEVYRAIDPRLDREVAVKILHLRSHQDPIALHRFEREARAVAALSHPNLLVLFDIGEADGRHFVVTELLKGQALRERLERGRLPWTEAARYAADIAAGLEAAHRKGLIHRDLNPRNLFLVDDGPVKVLDFGLVTYENRRQYSRDAAMTTNPGSLVGTSGYISPEQVAGDSVDRRTDIFALGCCLYEMVTGERAFRTRTLADLVNLRDPAPATDFVPDLPAELVAIITRCLRRTREDRFETARDLEIALRALLNDERALSPKAEVDATPQLVVAVLPFAGGQREYLNDGLAEGIIRALSALSSLRVIGWSSSARYKTSAEDPLAIGMTLKVDALLTGRMMSFADGEILSLELIMIPDGRHLWGERFDLGSTAAWAEIPAMIAAQVARNLKIEGQLPSSSRARLATAQSSEAHKLYLKGRFFWNKRSADGLRRARTFFQEALDQDPTDARAWVGLADAWAVKPFWGLVPPMEAFPKAKAAARRALALDPNLSEAWASLAYVQFYWEWQWTEAEKSFQRALDLDANSPTTLHWWGVCAALEGRFDRAQDLLDRAKEIDPLSLIIAADSALVAWWSGDFGRAVGLCRSALELDDRFPALHLYRALALEAQGAFDAASAAFQTAIELSGNAIRARAGLAHLLALRGHKESARTMLTEVLAESQKHYISRYPIALIHVGLDEIDVAFAHLEQAFSERCESLVWLRVDPRLANLRGDPRFLALEKRLADEGASSEGRHVLSQTVDFGPPTR